MFVVLIAIETLLFHSSLDLREMMIEQVHHAQQRNPDPQARPMFDYLTTPQGLMVMMITLLLFLCAVFVLLSGIGGMLSASAKRPKRPPG